MIEIELGDKVKCTVTGLSGVATARCLYLHGCDHIGIQPKADMKAGTVPSLVWVDLPQVALIKAAKKSENYVSELHGHGGPKNHPGKRNHPKYDDGVCLK